MVAIVTGNLQMPYALRVQSESSDGFRAAALVRHDQFSYVIEAGHSAFMKRSMKEGPRFRQSAKVPVQTAQARAGDWPAGQRGSPGTGRVVRVMIKYLGTSRASRPRVGCAVHDHLLAIGRALEVA